MAKRKKVPRNVHNKVLVDAMHRCCLCPEHREVVDLHHVVPISEGGPDTEDNLMAVCPTCHATIHRIRNRYTVEQLRMYKERWIQLCALGLPLDMRIAPAFDYTHPPTPSPSMTPPLPPQGVFGRDDALTQIQSLLALDDEEATNVPPVALYGMGGVGKTTLAIALGRLELISHHFPDGVLWVALGPGPPIRILLDDWGRALEMDLLAEPHEEACSKRLRDVLYDRRVLVIIDDIWEVAHAMYFTVAGPCGRTLVTTRESPVAYNLATRERALPVDVLSPEASLDLLRSLVPEAVASDERSTVRLCERLEFLPLALTLAGRFLAVEADVPSRMRRLVGELIERREARLQLLKAEGRLGLGERQPVSLQAILGMSVDRLSKTDQERFAMLAVFGGEPLTWEISAAGYVWECGIEEAEATISHFIQRGLVMRRGDRYWMHALLADCAAEMLETMGL